MMENTLNSEEQTDTSKSTEEEVYLNEMKLDEIDFEKKKFTLK